MATNPPQAPFREMKLDVKTEGGITAVYVSGPVTAVNVDEFKSQLKELVARVRRMKIDLSNVSYMDSTGLGAVVGVYVTAKSAKCQLELVNLSRQVRKLLSMANLLSLFEGCGQHNIKLP